MLPLVLLIVCLGLPLLYAVAVYNRLVALRNHIRDAWANIDTELKRRYDLIPALVATVKGYAAHERETLDSVTRLRARCMSLEHAPTRQGASETELGEALRRLLAVVEAYPALKADVHFLRLQKELVNTEDRIQAARRFYNGNVRDYRNLCEIFPSSLVAGLFGFRMEEYFAAAGPERDAPPAGSPGPEPAGEGEG